MSTGSQGGGESGLLPRHLCRVMGLNQNFSSRLGTPYHIQIEDRGPLFDDAGEEWVRRLNVIVYANYGEPNARIVHGRDHDLPDLRTQEHNRYVSGAIQELAGQVRALLEEREERQVARIKGLLAHYHRTRDEAIKREFEQANAEFPVLFARAWQELKQELKQDRARAALEAPLPSPDAEEIVYPLDSKRRDLVLDIERVASELESDLRTLKAKGLADPILLSACQKLLARARESLTRHDGSDFSTRRLEMTRNSLVTAFRQAHARARGPEGAGA